MLDVNMINIEPSMNNILNDEHRAADVDHLDHTDEKSAWELVNSLVIAIANDRAPPTCAIYWDAPALR